MVIRGCWEEQRKQACRAIHSTCSGEGSLAIVIRGVRVVKPHAHQQRCRRNRSAVVMIRNMVPPPNTEVKSTPDQTSNTLKP